MRTLSSIVLRVALLVLGLVLWNPTPGVAADDMPFVVGGAVGASSQRPGESEFPYLAPGYGGTSASAIVFADSFMGRNVSLGADLSINRDIQGRQYERAPGGANQLASRHHDLTLLGMLKARTPSSYRFQAAVGGGAGLARRHTERNGFFVRDFPPRVEGPITEIFTDNVFAMGAAGDAMLAVARHVSLAAVFRLYKLKDEDRLPDGVVKRGVSSLIFRFGAGATLRF